MKSTPAPRGARGLLGPSLALCLLAWSPQALALEVYLLAAPHTKVMHDGQSVPMWGFALCDSSGACGVPDSPGPLIEVPAGEGLTVHLDNQLPVPISFQIPGQGGGDPVFFTDGLGRQRVRSMTAEVAPGASGTATYLNLPAGTLRYESGTMPSIQVPMGLYGGVVVGPGAASCAAGMEAAYTSVESCFHAEQVLIYSEVDPAQNFAVAGSAAPADYPSTVDYAPSYLLVNGESSASIPVLTPGDTLLLRLINAGLESRFPELSGAPMSLLARDGFALPGSVQTLSSVELAAGGILDLAVVTPSADSTLGLLDRGARSSYSGAPGGGAAVEVVVGAGRPEDPTPTIYAVEDSFALDEDSSLLGDSVLANDVGLAGATVALHSQPAHGLVSLSADGSFVYIPDADYAGTDSFVYIAELDGLSYPATVTLVVSHLNDPPVALADGPYTNTMGSGVLISAPGLLGNDRDVDGDALTAVLVDPPASGTLLLQPDGSFEFEGGSPGELISFTYMVTDGVEYSEPVEVSLELLPVAGIALTVVDSAGAAVSDYRWLVQEDRSFKVDPAAPPAFLDSQVANFHRSHMPVVVQGTTTGGGGDDFAQLALDPDKHYYLSVLPLDGGAEEGGHSMSGAPIPPGTTEVQVKVASHPIPTAQVSVLVFEDLSPINGAWDLGEVGLGGFQITLEDAGGRYGANGGQMSLDAFGNPLKNSLDCFGGAEPPTGVILSCPDGTVLIKDLPPGKYGVIVNPPAEQSASWVQSSTIEGTRVIDAWVQAGEPPFFSEWGPGPHAFVGFVNPEHNTVPAVYSPAERVNTITGNVTLFHDPRPPQPFGTTQTGNYDGLGFTQAWVGLNSLAGTGESYAVVQADPEGNFEITGIPNGEYQLVVWDTFLDQIIGYTAVSLSGSGAALGDVPVFAWFSRIENNVFLDSNQNGLRDPGEEGLPEQNINVRFRDGSIYQTFPTDTEGFVPFDELFPFFSWLVVEVDYARFKATGLTATVDGGGDTSGSPYPGILSLQQGSPRTEEGPVLTEAFQVFAGQTNVFDWGKAPYAAGENGGISGIVYYASTRAEFNPRLAAADPWERGLPGVTVRLYQEVSTAGGGTALSLIDETTTDSWDDSLPEGCPGEDPGSAFVSTNLGAAQLERCYDGWRNFNQARPGIFDGGYAFTDIPPGDYIVEVVPPPGYELVKEEDINVGYGDVFEMAAPAVVLPGGGALIPVPDIATVVDSTAEPGLAQPPCVGELRTVPDVLSLFPDTAELTPFAGYSRALCDRKQVHLPDQGQAAADFFLFTSTPIAAQFAGLILDDVAIEPDPASPNYSEKWSPPYLPVSIKDFQGTEVYRTYSDGYGRYNGMAASTYTANIPNPSGYSPAMYSICLNAAGTAAHPEAHRNRNYSEVCTNFQFMPGTTTYLDTPVLPASAFSAGYNQPDCAATAGTPEIASVSPLVAAPTRAVTLRSMGRVDVPNPEWRGPTAAAPYDQPFVSRDYGFGATEGRVHIGGRRMTVTSWTDEAITFRVPARMAAGAYQMVVTHASGHTSVHAITLTVGTESPTVVSPGGSIQAAIDAAAPGDLIVVEPGVYNESVVMWKPVRLQGSGAGSTFIRAVNQPSARTQAWREKVAGLVESGEVDLLPGQAANLLTAFGGGVLESELGAGILVLAGIGEFDLASSRIDGFTISDAVVGGGLVVNGYAHHLQISNNVITENSGWLGGGLRVGDPMLVLPGGGPYDFNRDVYIHHNSVVLNAATAEFSAGGGITLASGADGYRVTDNFICGNLTTGYGAGIGHLGLSDGGEISRNTVLYNQNVNPTFTRSGGGIFIGGLPEEAGLLSEGAGSVLIDSNLIQGNMAASGHGGGIRAEFVNGQDVELSADPLDWYELDIINNLIVNNVATWSGGGISLQDTVNANILHNTIAHNDSTATAGPLLNLSTGLSEAQPAGISSAQHSAELGALLPAPIPSYSYPNLVYNVIWRNRSFYFDATSGGARLMPELAPAATGECAAGASYWDLGVLNSAESLNPTYSVLTVATGSTHRSTDPRFQTPICNTDRPLGAGGPMDLVVAVDEGGTTSVEVRYGPLSRGSSDYHIRAGSSAANFLPVGPSTGVALDVDGQTRPRGPRVDAGADER